MTPTEKTEAEKKPSEIILGRTEEIVDIIIKQKGTTSDIEIASILALGAQLQAIREYLDTHDRPCCTGE